MLPSFNTYLRQSHFFDIYNKGKGQLDWNIKVSDSWIQIDKVKGSTVCEERIWVSVDWSKVPVGDRVTGIIEVTTKNDKKENIYCATS